MEMHFVVQFVLGIHMSCKMNYLIHYVQFLHSYTCYKIHLSTLTSMLHKNSVYCILQSSLNISLSISLILCCEYLLYRIVAVHRYLNVLFTAARHRGDVCEVVMLTVTVSVEVVSLSHGAVPGALSCERDNRPSATDVLGRKRRARRAETCGRQLRGVTREDGAAAQHTVAPSSRVPAQPSPAQPSCQDTGYYE